MKNSNKVEFVINKVLLRNKAALIMILMACVIGLIQPIFFTTDNLFNVLRQVCASTILAMGFTFVLGLGEIDLSVGAILGLNGVIMAKLMMEANWPVWLAILIALAAGAAFGIANACIISALDIPPFIVTLATQSLFRGMVYIITGMVPISSLPASFVNIGQGYLGPVPIPVIIMVVVIIISYIIANYSTFGRHVIAMGGNASATRACGVNIKLVRMGVYIVTGICSSIAAVVTTARSASAQIAAGKDMEMDVIAAVVIGGTAMSGGNMNIIGTVFGCIIVGMITNGMNLMGINSNYQVVAKGALILLALVIDRMSNGVYAKFVQKKSLKEAEEASKNTAEEGDKNE